MYSIDTLKIEEEILILTIKYESKVIGEKILELSFNENKSPTFVESGCIYFSEEFDLFIKSINLDTTSDLKFSFDDQERFDGFMIETRKDTKYLLIKTLYEQSHTAIFIELNEETIQGIKSDLNHLRSQIDLMIETQTKYYDILANPYDCDEESTNSTD